MPTDPADSFVQAVIRAREAQGVSQAGLARNMSELGHRWHQTTAAKVEAGERRLMLGEAYALTALLGVPL